MAGLAASIIGIIDVGTKVTLLIFEIASDLGSAGEDVQWLGTEVSAFCWVLQDLRSTLERAKSSGYSLDSLKSMRIIMDYCKAILERIQKVLDKIIRISASGERQKLSAMDKMKWIFSKSKVQGLRARLDSAKSTLSVMMTGFNWALLLEQKTLQSEISQAEIDRQSDLFRSMLVSQQFIVQRLEDLEKNDPDGQVDNEREDENLIPATSSLPRGNFSHTLNSAIFHDGMSASERRWTTQGAKSADQSLKVLNNFSQSLVYPEPVTIWHSFVVKVLFKPTAPRYQKFFVKEPTQEMTTTITIDPFDDKFTIVWKALASLGIVYDPSHYCLHSECIGHLTAWNGECGSVLKIQNTLWGKCCDTKYSDRHFKFIIFRRAITI